MDRQSHRGLASVAGGPEGPRDRRTGRTGGAGGPVLRSSSSCSAPGHPRAGRSWHRCHQVSGAIPNPGPILRLPGRGHRGAAHDQLPEGNGCPKGEKLIDRGRRTPGSGRRGRRGRPARTRVPRVRRVRRVPRESRGRPASRRSISRRQPAASTSPPPSVTPTMAWPPARPARSSGAASVRAARCHDQRLDPAATTPGSSTRRTPWRPPPPSLSTPSA